jgi:hypothetical protein
MLPVLMWINNFFKVLFILSLQCWIPPDLWASAVEIMSMYWHPILNVAVNPSNGTLYASCYSVISIVGAGSNATVNAVPVATCSDPTHVFIDPYLVQHIVSVLFIALGLLRKQFSWFQVNVWCEMAATKEIKILSIKWEWPAPWLLHSPVFLTHIGSVAAKLVL